VLERLVGTDLPAELLALLDVLHGRREQVLPEPEQLCRARQRRQVEGARDVVLGRLNGIACRHLEEPPDRVHRLVRRADAPGGHGRA
jgi:hypothetical protein